MIHRELIVSLAVRQQVASVYFSRFFVAGGGLVSYGPDFADLFRRAAGYFDRILKGESRPICRCRRRPNTSW